MTPITRARPITRDLELRHRGRDLVARVGAEGVYLKGARQRWATALFLSWAAAYDVAAKIRAVQIREERAAERKARRAT